MGVIPESFPNITIPEESKSYETEETNFECMESKSEENMIGLTYSERKEINDLMKEFDDVLKDNIDDKKYVGEECDIIFKTDIPIVPYKVLTARSPPLAFQPTCKQKIENMIEGGMIVEDNSPSEWLARSHFVPKKTKNGEMRARHVVNFQELNDQIQRPVRGFRTINELRAGVRPES